MDGMRLLVIVIVIVSCVLCCLCHPAKPLNERSPEFSWQAWLLVDDQNQGGRHSTTGNVDATLKQRRITPKSVFIAPTFSPQDLPPCAEGYASDPMGRCMKIFKLDEDEHLNFLLDKLKEKFGGADLDYGDDDEDVDGDGDSPLQINIPLGSDEVKTSNSDEESDMAIVVAPTNSNFTVQEFVLNSSDHVDVQTSNSDVNVRISSVTDSYETTTEFSTIPTTVAEETTITTEAEIITSTTLMSTTTEETTSTEPTTETQTTTMETQTVPTTSQKTVRVRFPDDSALPENDLIGNTRQTLNRVRHSERNFWPNFSNGPVTQQQQIKVKFPENTGTRKFTFPVVSGGAENLQKPLVLRFSKKNTYVDQNQFKRPDFYRALPPNELSYIFGFKHRSTNN